MISNSSILSIMYFFSSSVFNNDAVNRPAIRVVDLVEKSEKLYVDLLEIGYNMEPEMIDYHGDVCYYSDAEGNLYSIEF